MVFSPLSNINRTIGLRLRTVAARGYIRKGVFNFFFYEKDTKEKERSTCHSHQMLECLLGKMFIMYPI